MARSEATWPSSGSIPGWPRPFGARHDGSIFGLLVQSQESHRSHSFGERRFVASRSLRRFKSGTVTTPLPFTGTEATVGRGGQCPHRHFGHVDTSMTARPDHDASLAISIPS